MGLCKCPKRKVTNQFCFEHRVNVCEHCMVSLHAKCIIQSYLQWLQDSDYNPKCELCLNDLVSGDCIRLTCYHVLHWACLDTYCRQLPATTAPAGYTCPLCHMCIFPAKNLVSPVADVLREKLAGVNWARAGLGLPLLSEDREVKPVSCSAPVQTNSVSNGASAMPSQYSVVHVDDQGTFNREKNTEAFQAARRGFQDIRETQCKVFDHDDDKYKRRPISERLGKLWRIARSMHPVSPGGSIYRRYFMLLFIVCLVIIVMILIMSRLGHYYTENDPSLELMNNPNIHVAAESI